MNSLRGALANAGVDPTHTMALRALHQQQYTPDPLGDRASQEVLERAGFPYPSLRALLTALEWPPEWRVTTGAPPTPGYLDDPKGRELTDMGWGDSLQGVTHDDDYWYFSTVIETTSGHASNAMVMKVARDTPLSTGALVAAERVPVNDEHGHPLAAGYCHYGDIDYYNGYIFVPAEGDYCGPGNPGRLIVLDTNLKFVCSADVSRWQGPSSPWCAINPLNGYLYTSIFNDDPGPLRLCVYKPTVKPDEQLQLDFVGYFQLRNEVGDTMIASRIQGGAFSNRGHLYLVIDSATGGAGVVGFDMLTGRITARFHVLYDPDAGQELEGMTIWDRVDGDGARHQVHVIMVEHDDSLYFKHYEVEPGHVALI